MKILRYLREGAAAYGVLEPDGTIRSLHGSPFDGLRLGPAVATTSEVRVLAPVTPSKIVMVGANFYSHLEGTPAPGFPMLFLKPPSAIIGPDDPIVIPRIAGSSVDYEAELTVVIGKRARHVAESEALEYVLGYTIGNDVSARAWQLREMKTGVLLRGKGFDTFAPIGPVVETDLDATDVRIEARVNGVVGHRIRTAGDMIFPVAALIADVTQGITLMPGDVIMTGTTAYGSLKPGDTIEMTMDGIGTLRNSVVAEEGEGAPR